MTEVKVVRRQNLGASFVEGCPNPYRPSTIPIFSEDTSVGR